MNWVPMINKLENKYGGINNIPEKEFMPVRVSDYIDSMVNRKSAIIDLTNAGLSDKEIGKIMDIAPGYVQRLRRQFNTIRPNNSAYKVTITKHGKSQAYFLFTIHDFENIPGLSNDTYLRWYKYSKLPANTTIEPVGHFTCYLPKVSDLLWYNGKLMTGNEYRRARGFTTKLSRDELIEHYKGLDYSTARLTPTIRDNVKMYVKDKPELWFVYTNINIKG